MMAIKTTTKAKIRTSPIATCKIGNLFIISSPHENKHKPAQLAIGDFNKPGEKKLS